MSHECIVVIDNTANTSALALQTLSGPTSKSADPMGTWSLTNTNQKVDTNLTVAAGATISFNITANDFDTAGATMIWTTGSGSTAATITMVFQNHLISFNNVSIDVQAQPGATDALLTYGVSYLEASQENDKEMARDYLNKFGLANSPVYVNFNIKMNSYAETPPTTPFLPGITNVVMLMLENRGFDHMLGELYTVDPAYVYPVDSKVPAGNSKVENPINFDGIANNPGITNTDLSTGKSYNLGPVAQGTYNIPSVDPGEQWLDANQQIYDSTANPPTGTAAMSGFIDNYIAQGTVAEANYGEIMQYYTPTDLPVLSTLAKSYAVSDAWFCSVPSQTSPNRAFSLSGTSSGYVDNYNVSGIPATKEAFALETVVFGTNTIFNVLSNCGLDTWKIYYQQDLNQLCLTEALFSKVFDNFYDTDKVADYSTFESDVKNGTLPPFSYVEPTWAPDTTTGAVANDYHPPYNVCPGETNLAAVYNLLTTYKDWDTTLFIVTFDEHGGTYDHVVPPSSGVTPPDNMTDWSNFGFDRLGIRIPTLLISPMIKAGTVFRSPDATTSFDHTSFVRTILGWQGIDVSSGMMGARTMVAPDFSGILETSAVNSGPGTLIPPNCTGTAPDPNMELNDLQYFIMPMLVERVCGVKKDSGDYETVLKALKACKTAGELSECIAKYKVNS